MYTCTQTAPTAHTHGRRALRVHCMCTACPLHVQVEADLKASAEQLADMSLFLDELGVSDDDARKECEALTEELQARRDTELSEMWNLELPFKLKQGQLEVEEAAVVTDYSEVCAVCVL